jgi:hypothetical protein
MSITNFKSKIKKLIDARHRVESLIELFSKNLYSTNENELDKIIHESEFLLSQLSEFNTFHAYSIMKRLTKLFKQIKNKKVKDSKNLSEIITHLMKLCHQQIILIQNVIENKVIADDSLTLLDMELEKKGHLFSFLKKDVKLPALTFTSGSDTNTEAMALVKKEIVETVPTHMNVAINDKKFSELQDSYKSLIVGKNRLANSEDEIVNTLCNSINDFTGVYEELSHISVSFYLNNVVDKLKNYLSQKNKNFKIDCFWGSAKFSYYKVDLLEKFLLLSMEMLADYQVKDSDENSYIEIKTDITNSSLNIIINSSFSPIDIDDEAESVDDHRVTILKQYQDKLGANRYYQTTVAGGSSYIVSLPLRNNVYSAYLMEANGVQVFVLEDEVKEFCVLDEEHIERKGKDVFFTWNDKKIQVQSIDDEPSYTGKIGAIFSQGESLMIFAGDEIIKKEQIFLKVKQERVNNSYRVKGFVTYGEESLPVIDGTMKLDINSLKDNDREVA